MVLKSVENKCPRAASLKNGRQGADTISRGRKCVKKCGRGPKQLSVVRDTCTTMKMGGGVGNESQGP